MAFEVLELTVGLLELAEFAVRSAFGWRFVFSRRYRAATLDRWRSAPMRVVVTEAGGALVGVLLTGMALAWAATR
jgi:hypothetical protein